MSRQLFYWFTIRLVNQAYSLEFFQNLLNETRDIELLNKNIESGQYFTRNLTKPEILAMVNASEGDLAYWTNTDTLATNPAFACSIYSAWKIPSPVPISLAIRRGSPYQR